MRFSRLTRHLVVALALGGGAIVPALVHAQGWNVELAAGTAKPVRPTNPLVTLGYQIGIGASHRSDGSPLALGAEIGLAYFGETQLVYIYPPCRSPGCTGTPPARNLELVNYFATAKYDVGTGRARPYLALAGGLTQGLSSGDWNGTRYDHAIVAGGRASAGIDARVGGGSIGLDVSYVTAPGLTYEQHPVRYVPVTMRFSF